MGSLQEADGLGGERALPHPQGISTQVKCLALKVGTLLKIFSFCVEDV